MPYKSSDLTANEKIISIYNLLLFSSRAFSHTELSARFACSKSTITRYIAVFEKLFPDMLVKEKEGNSLLYSFKNNKPYRACLCLSHDELELLINSKEFISKFPSKKQEMYRETIDKIINVFGAFDKNKI